MLVIVTNEQLLAQPVQPPSKRSRVRLFSGVPVAINKEIKLGEDKVLKALVNILKYP